MKAWEFYAVVYDGEVYCVECLPQGIKTTHPDVSPIFAVDEWDIYPVCCVCGTKHDYVSLTANGQRYERGEGI